MKKVALCCALIGIVTILSAEPTAAKIILKAASSWPKNSPNVTDLDLFTEVVNAQGKGELEIQWAGTAELIKAANLLGAAGVGTVDIVQGDLSYLSGIVSETGIIGLPVISWSWDYCLDLHTDVNHRYLILGAAPVNVPTEEVYMALHKGGGGRHFPWHRLFN